MDGKCDEVDFQFGKSRSMAGDDNTYILVVVVCVTQIFTYENEILFNSHHFSSDVALALTAFPFDSLILQAQSRTKTLPKSKISVFTYSGWMDEILTYQ